MEILWRFRNYVYVTPKRNSSQWDSLAVNLSPECSKWQSWTRVLFRDLRLKLITIFPVHFIIRYRRTTLYLYQFTTIWRIQGVSSINIQSNLHWIRNEIALSNIVVFQLDCSHDLIEFSKYVLWISSYRLTLS